MSTGTDFTIIKELIREALDPVVLLDHYGVNYSSRSIKYDKIRCACPIHHGDNDTGFSFDLNSKTFTCFTNHCGSQFQGRDVFIFVRLMEESRTGRPCSFPKVMQICSEITGIDIRDSSYDKDIMDKLDNQKWVRQMARINQKVELDVYNEDEIEVFKAQLPLCNYLDARRFDESVIDFFQIGYSPEGIDEPNRANQPDFAGRIIFPVRNAGGKLVGWSGRLAIDDKEIVKKHRKWMHKIDFEKGFILYNFNNALDFVKDTRELILVEGAFDVMRLWSYGICNVAAVMGSSLTPEQLSIAVSSATKVKVFLDGDGAGKSGARRICEQLRKYVDVYLITPPDNKDPDELDFDEAWNCVTNASRYIP